MLDGLRVVLGVTGGIAAYKAVHLVRLLTERGAQVRVVMTAGALHFVGPQSFYALTGQPVQTDLFDGTSGIPHTELARWADVIVVAPATAKLLAKLSHGISDDLLSATLLASDRPVVLAPAMHTEMWNHPATRRNVHQLREDGHILVGPGSGALAGGDEGEGRMAEPEEIVRMIGGGRSLDGWRVLVTAGGTREPIDPVRYVGNRSSGKMGHAVAEEAAARGARVTLVSTAGLPVRSGIELVAVESASEMAEAVWERVEGQDVVVMAAAVADFRPKAAAEEKLRRAAGPPELVLEGTPDILAGVVERVPEAFVVGFAAETGGVEEAVEKARRKGVDLLVANDVTAPDSGFGSDTNRVSVFDPTGQREDWPLVTKREVARLLWNRIETATGPEHSG